MKRIGGCHDTPESSSPHPPYLHIPLSYTLRLRRRPLRLLRQIWGITAPTRTAAPYIAENLRE